MPFDSMIILCETTLGFYPGPVMSLPGLWFPQPQAFDQVSSMQAWILSHDLGLVVSQEAIGYSLNCRAIRRSVL